MNIVLSRQRRSTKQTPMNATSEGSLRAVEACVNETLAWSGRGGKLRGPRDAPERDEQRIYGAVDFDVSTNFRLPQGVCPSRGIQF